MQGLNKVQLIGHLGKNPEYLEFENGNKLAKFSVATTESYKDDAGKLITQTEWHSIIIWGNLAQYAHQYLKKGQLVYVEGKLKTRSFEEKDKPKRYVTEVIAEKITNLEKVKADKTTEAEPKTDINEDFDLPF